MQSMNFFELALLILGFMIGFAGGAKPERWQRTLAIIVAASLPLQTLLGSFAYYVFVHGFNEPGSRSGLGFGFALAVSVTPIWIVVAFLGSWLRGRISRRR
jgi:hypothetical protein